MHWVWGFPKPLNPKPFMALTSSFKALNSGFRIEFYKDPGHGLGGLSLGFRILVWGFEVRV